MSIINYLIWKTNALSNWQTIERYVKLDDTPYNIKINEHIDIDYTFWRLGFQIIRTNTNIMFMSFVPFGEKLIYNHRSIHKLNGELVTMQVYYTETNFETCKDYMYLTELINGLLTNLDNLHITTNNKMDVWTGDQQLVHIYNKDLTLKTINFNEIEKTINFNEMEKYIGQNISILFPDLLQNTEHVLYLFSKKEDNEEDAENIDKETTYNKYISSIISQKVYGNIVVMSDKNINRDMIMKICRYTQSINNEKYQQKCQNDLMEMFKKNGKNDLIEMFKKNGDNIHFDSL
jgi:hypothetical protein